jgi:hypothetical protein
VKNNITSTTTYQTGDFNTQIDLDIPLNVAIEGKLNDTWSINAGVNATLVETDLDGIKNNPVNTADSPTDRYNQTWLDINPYLDYAIGVTGKIGDLTIDLNIDPNIILNGPYLISGESTSSMVMDLCFKYAWK